VLDRSDWVGRGRFGVWFLSTGDGTVDHCGAVMHSHWPVSSGQPCPCAERGNQMRLHRRIAVGLVGILSIAVLSRHGASASAPPSGSNLAPTGVYFGFCGNEITTGVLDFGQVVLYGLGNQSDPSCGNAPPSIPLQPLPISSSQVLSNLAVASTEVQNSQTVPSTITLYVDGTPTALTCTVSELAPNCHDNFHKIAVGPSSTFSVCDLQHHDIEQLCTKLASHH
jgi:hypothetical protein